MNDSAGYTDTLQAGHLGAAPDVGPVHFQPIILRFGSIYQLLLRQYTFWCYNPVWKLWILHTLHETEKQFVL